LTVEQEPKQAAASQQGAGARAIGERFQLGTQSLELLLAEVRERLESLDQAIAEDTRAQLKGAVREISKVLDWCDAAAEGLGVESAKALAGLQPIDVTAVCQQIADAHSAAEHPIAVLAHQQVHCWSAWASLSDAVEKALELVGARTGGRGLRRLEIQWRDRVPSIRVCSRGEPGGEIAPSLIEEFRLAVAGAGITVVPDDLGPGGAGMLLLLPV